MPLIPSSNIIWHAFILITDTRFLGLVYHSYVLYILKMGNGLAKVYTSERENILFQKHRIIYIYIYIYINAMYIIYIYIIYIYIYIYIIYIALLTLVEMAYPIVNIKEARTTYEKSFWLLMVKF